MKKFIRDLYQTQQPDGTYKWDMTNPSWSVTPWIVGAFSYVGVGVFGAIQHPSTFDLMQYATGFGALISGGGIGVMFHSRSNT